MSRRVRNKVAHAERRAWTAMKLFTLYLRVMS